MAHPRRGEATVSLTRSMTALRRACATGRDAQTVTVRRGHLRELLAEYDRLTTHHEPAPAQPPPFAAPASDPVEVLAAACGAGWRRDE